MLILDHQEAIYCQVVRPSQGKFDKLPGLLYDERLFCKIESYPITDYKAAVNRTRQLFDQAHQKIFFYWSKKLIIIRYGVKINN